jgi:hypothetical protein
VKRLLLLLVLLGAACGSPATPSATPTVCRTVTTPAHDVCETVLVGATLTVVCRRVEATTVTACGNRP